MLWCGEVLRYLGIRLLGVLDVEHVVEDVRTRTSRVWLELRGGRGWRVCAADMSCAETCV
ncbi:hypothetical protein M378DRAFT_167784 [Amanita muscaria Koide BX008]|uniref:Uncharacterized protein n=1 Tax=Amanita muscaria (strain Koide BX008) TaxID=946122 RepID=A0A0C2WVH7_AMAMK|nr:hypothetical protein M378DRAFT_167784 [Amanita muscaria Koide BX008]